MILPARITLKYISNFDIPIGPGNYSAEDVVKHNRWSSQQCRLIRTLSVSLDGFWHNMASLCVSTRVTIKRPLRLIMGSSGRDNWGKLLSSCVRLLIHKMFSSGSKCACFYVLSSMQHYAAFCSSRKLNALKSEQVFFFSLGLMDLLNNTMQLTAISVSSPHNC